MRCYICDADSDSVTCDHGVFGPCADCQSAIQDCLDSYQSVEAQDPVGGGPARHDLEEVLLLDWDV